MLLVGKPEENRPVGRQRPRWVDSIKMNLGEIGRCGVDWICVAQDREHLRAFVSAVMSLHF
jgi:hypothetical protein